MGQVKKKSTSDEVCERCGATLVVGDYPYCDGVTGHGTMFSRNASVAAPTVVFRNKKGEYRFPGRDTDKPPKGFVRVELSNQRARDRFEKEVGARETAKLREVEYGRRAAYDATIAASKERLLAIKARTGSDFVKRFVDVCIRKADEKRETFITRSEAGFHIESNHHDAQNRMPWQDKDTGWKGRR